MGTCEHNWGHLINFLATIVARGARYRGQNGGGGGHERYRSGTFCLEATRYVGWDGTVAKGRVGHDWGGVTSENDGGYLGFAFRGDGRCFFSSLAMSLGPDG